MIKIFIFFLFSNALSAFAYPEFIGYGYSACLTCHFNGHGGGALNDYGRALWSAEIASRVFYSSKKSDEDIAGSSGFFGSKELPWWIRPAVKYRSIWIKQPLGSPNSRDRWYNMQVDLNLTLLVDPEQKYIFYYTLGSVPTDQMVVDGKVNRFISREYFFRWQTTKNLWTYAGLMDKVYGLRNIDHTSYQRSQTGNTQIDQSQGIILHYIQPKWELSGNYFTGNPYQDPDLRQRGYSLMYENETQEKTRLGISYLQSSGNLDHRRMVAAHVRKGVAQGSSIMAEYGFIEKYIVDQTGSTGDILQSGSYFFAETTALLTRGYLFHISGERYNAEFKPSVPDQWRWTIGILAFPAPRFELRTDFVTGRTIFQDQSQDDTWAFWEQLHVSL